MPSRVWFRMVPNLAATVILLTALALVHYTEYPKIFELMINDCTLWNVCDYDVLPELPIVSINSISLLGAFVPIALAAFWRAIVPAKLSKKPKAE